MRTANAHPTTDAAGRASARLWLHGWSSIVVAVASTAYWPAATEELSLKTAQLTLGDVVIASLSDCGFKMPASDVSFAIA